MDNLIDLHDNDYNIEINNMSHFHIKEIQILNGDDNHIINEILRVKIVDNKINFNIKDTKQKAPGRLRFEPAARLILESEHNDQTIMLTLYHHKGSLNLKVESYDI